MKFSDILPTQNTAEILQVVDNSAEATLGSLFLSYSASPEKNLTYTKQALDNGAVVCSIFEFEDMGENFFFTSDMPSLLDKLYPRKDSLRLIGITGTNGKTSVAYIAHQALSKLGLKAGFIGTIGVGSARNIEYLGYTTPPLLKLYQILADFSANDYAYCVMEVSSHSVSQRRIGNLAFEYGVLTNITPEHLDYHKDMQTYANVKKSFLLDSCKHQIINIDDPDLADFAKICPAPATFGLTAGDIHITNWQRDSFNLVVDGVILPEPIHLPWIGDFYISNFLAVMQLCRAINRDTEILALISAILDSSLPKGRMELVLNTKGYDILIDFAHTPDALEKFLQAIKKYFPDKPITLVFGCGGNRDITKRAVMGSLAEQYATNIIITNDNPRFENPETIATDILAGVQNASKVWVELDREVAIRLAIDKFKDTIILIAGKGHEETQEINGISHKFSDFETITDCLNQL